MRTETIDVTPEQAKVWLEGQAFNRGLSEADVENYAYMMRTGKFYLTPGGLAFDLTVRLRDGQHRLAAVVRTGLTVRFRVHWDCTEDELRAIDQGRPRTVSDVIRIQHQDRYAFNKTPVVRLMVRLERGMSMKSSEALYLAVRENLGSVHLDSICNISRGRVASPGLTALVYARPLHTELMDLLLRKMLNRDAVLTLEEKTRTGIPGELSANNQTLETMLRVLSDKLKLHHDPGSSARKMMRCVSALLEGERLSRVQDTDQGYLWLKDQRLSRGFLGDVVPDTYARRGRGVAQTFDPEESQL